MTPYDRITSLADPARRLNVQPVRVRGGSCGGPHHLGLACVSDGSGQ